MSRLDQEPGMHLSEEETLLLPARMAQTKVEEDSTELERATTLAELLTSPIITEQTIAEHLESLTRSEALKHLFMYVYLTLIYLYKGEVEIRKAKRKPKESQEKELSPEELFLEKVDRKFVKTVDSIISSARPDNKLYKEDIAELNWILSRISNFFYTPGIGTQFYTTPFDITVLNQIDSKKRRVAKILQDEQLSMDYFEGYKKFVEKEYISLRKKKRLELSQAKLAILVNSPERTLVLQKYFIDAMYRLREKLGDLILPEFYEQVEEWRELKATGGRFENYFRGPIPAENPFSLVGLPPASRLMTSDDLPKKVDSE